MLKRLKELRLSKNLRQEDLGKLFGATKSAVSMWESGKREPDKETFLAMAEYFNVSVDYLMGRDDDISKPLDRRAEQLQEGNLLLSQMDDELREQALQYFRFLLSQRK